MNRLILLIAGVSFSGYSLSDDIQDKWSSLDNKAFRAEMVNNGLCLIYTTELSDRDRSINYDKELSYYNANFYAMAAYKSCGFNLEEARVFGCNIAKISLFGKYVHTQEYSLDDCKINRLDKSKSIQCFSTGKTYIKKFIMPLIDLRLGEDFDNLAKYPDHPAGKYAQLCGYEG